MKFLFPDFQDVRNRDPIIPETKFSYDNFQKMFWTTRVELIHAGRTPAIMLRKGFQPLCTCPEIVACFHTCQFTCKLYHKTTTLFLDVSRNGKHVVKTSTRVLKFFVFVYVLKDVRNVHQQRHTEYTRV